MRSLRGVIVLVLALALSAPVFAADFQAGGAAYGHGDYATALEEWLPLAEQGDAAAQISLGVMYSNGLGVTQDYAEAIKWYRLAAEQGNVPAQAFLADMYYRGEGVSEDDVMAHMWAYLAAAQGNKDAAKLRDAIVKKMTPAQIAEAQRLAREWKPKK